MKDEYTTEDALLVLDQYGLTQVLEDNGLNTPEVLLILEELYYIDLDQYFDGLETEL